MTIHELKRSSKVLVVERNKDLRYMVHNAIRKIGFRSISGVESIKEVFDKLNSEEVDWLLVPFDQTSIEEVFQILKMTNLYPELNHLRITAFVDPNHHQFISQAYECGLMSTFDVPADKFNIEKPIDEFKIFLTKHAFDTCLVASEYLRRFLIETKNYSSLLRFEEELLQLYPGNIELLLHLAKAQALNDQGPNSESTLQQAIFLNPKYKEVANKIRASYIKDKFSKTHAKAKGGNFLGLERVVLVDSDESCNNRVEDILMELGVQRVEKFTDPQTALDHLEHQKPPSILIQEWKLPKINGPIFVQRLRQGGLADIPLIIHSSLVNPQTDMPLIKEMGVSNIISKPVDRSKFLKGLIWTVQQLRRPTDLKGFDLKFHSLLIRRKIDLAGRLLASYIKDQKIAEGESQYYKAEIAFAKGKYQSARLHAFSALKEGYRTVRSFNLAGKTLMKLRDFNNALKCFNTANNLSPMNIVRLCSMAEAHVEIGNESAGTGILDKIRNLDPRNSAIAVTEANFSLTKGDIKKAHKIMTEVENIDDILAFLNNRGIALARNKQIDEAINFYHQAIQAIPDEKRDKRSLVAYNLALAHARGGDLDLAKKALGELKKNANPRVAAKSEQLFSKVKIAIKTGQTLALDSSQQAEPASIVLPQLSKADPGGICCFMLFKDLARSEEDVVVVTSLPTFRHHASTILTA